MKPCLDCGRPTQASTCPACQLTRTRNREAGRGSREQRGYGLEHQAERRKWAARIAAGVHVDCARCGHPIVSGHLWQLDHTDDRTGYLGPSHQSCNIGAGNRARKKSATSF